MIFNILLNILILKPTYLGTDAGAEGNTYPWKDASLEIDWVSR